MSSAMNHRKRSHRSEHRVKKSAKANIFYTPSRWRKPSLWATILHTIRRILQPTSGKGRSGGAAKK